MPQPVSHPRRRPPVATALALVALFFALGGTAVAAKVITGKQVKNSSLTGKDIKNGSIAAADLAPGVGGAGTAGPAGAKGDTGAPGRNGTNGTDGRNGTDGADGQQGPAGPVAVVYAVQSRIIAPGKSETSADCPAGMSVIGGGTDRDLNSSFVVEQQGPADSSADDDLLPDDGWSITVRNTANVIVGLKVRAICTAASSTSEG